MSKINEFLHDNPQLLTEFMERHGDILRELRRRLQVMIAQSDLVGRYLMTRALMETVDISAQVAREALRERIAKRGLMMIMPSVKDPDKVH